jgi:phosphoribosylpyrophosphate synthetase
VQCRSKDVIIVDDMIDSSGTVGELSKKLQKEGASHIYVCASHGIFSGKALEELAKVRIPLVFFPRSTDRVLLQLQRSTLAIHSAAARTVCNNYPLNLLD